MPVENIDGVDFEVYRTAEEIDEYALGSVGDNADAWRLAEDEDKKRAAVSATRLLDRQIWQGEKAASSDVGAFPRTGLTYPDGSEVPSDIVPTELLDADAEIAMALIAGAAVQNDGFNATARRLKAGSVEIENFRSTGPGPRFPVVVMELVGRWLGGANGTGFGGSLSTGVDGCSDFRRGYGVSRGY